MKQTLYFQVNFIFYFQATFYPLNQIPHLHPDPYTVDAAPHHWLQLTSCRIQLFNHLKLKVLHLLKHPIRYYYSGKRKKNRLRPWRPKSQKPRLR